ncbi:sugar phosphate isomerase/epimerase family protein [Halomicrococcus gelatinilyticus]|uniref:sugar phosphate isomerase/epimerase family protein n=1 Tax=Halomicrococcus gelatinilyticus TaxID=1702103 RepID=UPI002E121550
MTRHAIQLYSLRTVERPLEDLIVAASEAGFEAVEYATRIRDADTGAVVEALDETGMESVAAHVAFDELNDDPGETVSFYRTLGCDRLVIPWLDEDHFENEDAIEETAHRLTSLAERVSDHGAALGYHNHVHEFRDVGGRPAFDRFAAASGEPLELEVDLGWAAAAGADPVRFLDRWHDRIPLVHVSDADQTRTPTEVGDGVLDVEACAAAVRRNDVEWAIYEHDEPVSPLESMVHGTEVLEGF